MDNITPVTFAEVANNYINVHAEIHCRQSTLNTYKSLLKNHIIPCIGDCNVNEITQEKLNLFILKKKTLSPKTINLMLTLIGAIMDGRIKRIRKLKSYKKEMDFLTKDEIEVLLATCKDWKPDFYALLYTAIYTGMRRGEILALGWGDINFTAGIISVNKTLYRGKIGQPKTANSFRKIKIPNELMAVLRLHKLRSIGSDIVFCNSVGKYRDAESMYQREYLPLLRKAGLGHKEFHALRHTYVALLIDLKAEPKFIQRQLGHSSMHITMDTYGHLMPDAGDDVIGQLLQKRDEVSQKEKINV